MSDQFDEFAKAKAQLQLELEADVLAGRGKLPRGNDGRVSPGFLSSPSPEPRPKLFPRGADDSRRFRGSETDPERPQETSVPRSADVHSLAALLGKAQTIAIAPAVLKIDQLERLERELAALLSQSAPHLWRQIRAPLRRLLNRARRELRAVDRRANLPT